MSFPDGVAVRSALGIIIRCISIDLNQFIFILSHQNELNVFALIVCVALMLWYGCLETNYTFLYHVICVSNPCGALLNEERMIFSYNGTHWASLQCKNTAYVFEDYS